MGSQPPLSQLQPFEGTRVLAAGLSKSVRDKVASIVEELGGTMLTTCSASEPPHVLLAKDVKGQRYLEVLSVAKTPVLKVDWIYACAKARKQLSYNGFRVPPLAGLVVCVTGVDQARRPALQATVESAGGSYSKDLVPSVSHLIAVSTKSEKYEMACTWPKTSVVSFQWLQDSLDNKSRQNESKYPVSKSVQNDMKRGVVKSGKEKEKLSAAAAAAAGAAVRTVSTSTSLSSLRLYFCGMNKMETKQARTLSRQLGATRFEAFNTSVTHVIAGRHARLDQGDFEVILHHVCRGPGILANIDWLEECRLHKAVVSPDMSSEALLRSLEKRSTGKPSSGNSQIFEEDSEGKEMKKVAVSGIFAGKRFSSYGLKDEEEKEAQQIVSKGPGLWQLNIPKTKFKSFPNLSYVLLPSCCEDTPAGIPAAKQVTMHWLRNCVQMGKIPKDGCILHKPLPYSVPLRDFTGVNLCASQYGSEEREMLYALTELLGGKSDDSLRRSKTTHLIIPEASGPKYSKCEKWGIHTVTAKWLLDSAKVGKKVEEDRYKPVGKGAPHKNGKQQSTANSKRAGFGEISSKKVVVALQEKPPTSRANSTGRGRQGKSSHISEPLPFPSQRQTRSSFSARRDALSTDSRKMDRKRGSSDVNQGTPTQDVISAIDRIEGLFQSKGNPSVNVVIRTRSRSQMEAHDTMKMVEEPERSEDSEPGFESSQRVTYGSESIVNKNRKLGNHGKLGISSVSDGDFAKRLLCKAVKSSRRNRGKADELKELNLL